MLKKLLSMTGAVLSVGVLIALLSFPIVAENQAGHRKELDTFSEKVREIVSSTRKTETAKAEPATQEYVRTLVEDVKSLGERIVTEKGLTPEELLNTEEEIQQMLRVLSELEVSEEEIPSDEGEQIKRVEKAGKK